MAKSFSRSQVTSSGRKNAWATMGYATYSQKTSPTTSKGRISSPSKSMAGSALSQTRAKGQGVKK